MKEEYKFIVRTYAKSDLAHLYCPEVPLNSALRIFKSWINQNLELSEKLTQTGYKSRNRYFCPKQVEIIRDYLGEP